MKILLPLAIGVFTVFSFFSCTTGSGIKFPCETKTVYRNLSEEYFAIAETYKSQNNYSKAIEYYTLALKNKELHDSAYYQIALCQVYNKNWAVARKSFRKLLRRDSENSTLKMSLAYIEAMCGNLKKAEKMYDHICAERPDDSEPLVNYINVLIADEKYTDAQEKLTFMEEKFPDEEHIDALKKKIQELTEDKSDDKEESDKEGKTSADKKSSAEGESTEELFGLNEPEEKEEEPATEKAESKKAENKEPETQTPQK